MIGLWCYVVINAGAPYSAAQWASFQDAFIERAMMNYLRALAAQYNLPHLRDWSFRISSNGQYAITRIVLDQRDFPGLQDLLLQISTARGYTGTLQTRLEKLMTDEIREALMNMGATPLQASLASASIVAYGNNMMQSIGSARAWIAARDMEWNDFPGRPNVHN